MLGQENGSRGCFTSEGVGFKCDGSLRISVLTTRAHVPWEELWNLPAQGEVPLRGPWLPSPLLPVSRTVPGT